jgi:hypothetical protein
VFQVLKPLLEDNIAPKIQRMHKIPERWFTDHETDKNDLINDLASYLDRIEFIETKDFIMDLEDKLNQFKAKNNKKILLHIEIANKYQSLHIGCNNYGETKSELYKEVFKSHEEV